MASFNLQNSTLSKHTSSRLTNQNLEQQTPIKQNHSAQLSSQQAIELQIQQGAQVQRRLFSFFYIYAIIIIGLYVTYAAYYYYQHHNRLQSSSTPNGRPTTVKSFDQLSAEAELRAGGGELELSNDEALRVELERKLESKIHLLERYIEVIAVDLQETKGRLREREKCDCSLSCTFNNTKYADQSSWQHQCDTCTCQMGRISCLPRKCPPINCDDAVQLSGQCCPICMKKCSYNNTLIRHGQKFKPLEYGKKECKCMDGLIKCEQAASKGNKQPATTSTPALVTLATSKNKQADLQAAPKQQIVATNSSELEGLARQPEVRLTR